MQILRGFFTVFTYAREDRSLYSMNASVRTAQTIPITEKTVFLRVAASFARWLKTSPSMPDKIAASISGGAAKNSANKP